MTGYNKNGDRVTIGNLALVRFVNTMVAIDRWTPTSKGVWCKPYKSTGRMLDELAVYR